MIKKAYLLLFFIFFAHKNIYSQQQLNSNSLLISKNIGLGIKQAITDFMIQGQPSGYAKSIVAFCAFLTRNIIADYQEWGYLKHQEDISVRIAIKYGLPLVVVGSLLSILEKMPHSNAHDWKVLTGTIFSFLVANIFSENNQFIFNRAYKIYEIIRNKYLYFKNRNLPRLEAAPISKIQTYKIKKLGEA